MTKQLHEQRQFAGESKERVRHLNVALIAFILLAIVDAIIGGTVSARLQVAGWTTRDQQFNNAYQLIYGIIVAGMLGWLYFHTRAAKPVLVILILYLGYVEDTLFYLFIPLVNPLISVLANGTSYRVPTGALFPERISGWVGWVGRMVWGQNVSFEISQVFLINILAIAAVLPLMRKSN